jgi:hypothetical protein
MKSPRPPANSRLPRVGEPGACGQSIRRWTQPSGARHSVNAAPGGGALLTLAPLSIAHGYGFESKPV